MNEMRVLFCFNIMRHEVPPEIVAGLFQLYPTEFPLLKEFTDLDGPVFYGPRFHNGAAR